MVQESEATTVGRSQPHTSLANGKLKGNETTPLLDELNPWDKSCVLTLDGGGIRGYASLWMLQILMEEIEKVELAHEEPHHTSFMPLAKDMQIPSGTNGHASAEVVEAPPRSRTNSTRLGIFRKRATNESLPQQEKEPQSSSDVSCHCKSNEGFLPCHYFDYIAGTSTGGLNAIMLGRLRMQVSDCLEAYPTMAEDIFTGKKRSVAKRIFMGTTSRYDAAPLEEQIKKIVGTKAPRGRPPLQEGFQFDTYPSPKDLCKTLVVANELDEGGIADRPYLFRSYNNNERSASGYNIWQVARATSAAPTYFDPIQIGKKEYSDGGVGNNNPIIMTVQDVMEAAGTTSIEQALGILVSIGAGQKPSARLKVKHKFPLFSNWKPVKQLSKLVRSLVNIAGNVEEAHSFIQYASRNADFRHYYRWTGGEEVGGLGMDEWEPKPKGDKASTAEFIRDNVKAYMERPDIAAQITASAIELVRRRRNRIAHEPEGGRWMRHTYCTVVRCPYCDLYLETRAVVKSHIQRVHPAKIDVDINLDRLVQNLDETHPRCRGGPF